MADDVLITQKQHTAGPQLIGFDYQFYYFMFLLLKLEIGQKIGFEVKDDIHIEIPDGDIVLFQTKHTVSKNLDGTSSNLSSLDQDLWKSLSNWALMAKENLNILSNHRFYLVTNKSESTNSFIDGLEEFKIDKQIDKIFSIIQTLESRTTDATLKGYFKNILSLRKGKLKLFLPLVTIVTDVDDIIGRVKEKIFERFLQADLVDVIFESLCSNLQEAKYLDIKQNGNFVISFSDFRERFGKCFRVAFKDRPLPRRTFPIVLPEKLESQTFVRQLIDIGEIHKDSPEVKIYTGQMLQAINLFSYWTDNNFVLPDEMNYFQDDTKLRWKNQFDSKYRQIKRKIAEGALVETLEAEIHAVALEVVDFIKQQNLGFLQDVLGLELSNGHFYALADKPEIGWHIDWEQRYKTR